MKIFSGTASFKLANEVAKILNLPLSKAEVIRFDDSEVRVTIHENVKNEECVVIQSTNKPTDTNLMELFFFCDALKRQEAKKVIGVIPYFGYARQNVQHRPGECVSVNVIVRFLEAIGFDKIYTFNIHAEATGGVFFIPFKNLDGFPFLAKQVAQFFNNQKIKLEDVVLVSPDQGAIEKVRSFGEYFYETKDFSEVVIEKKRSLDKKNQIQLIDLYGRVENKIALIVDDMIVSGSTLIPAAELCLKKGAKEVYAAIVHHHFTEKAIENIKKAPITKIFSTNTIELKGARIDKLIEFSIAPIIANELKI